MRVLIFSTNFYWNISHSKNKSDDDDDDDNNNNNNNTKLQMGLYPVAVCYNARQNNAVQPNTM